MQGTGSANGNLHVHRAGHVVAARDAARDTPRGNTPGCGPGTRASDIAHALPRVRVRHPLPLRHAFQREVLDGTASPEARLARLVALVFDERQWRA